MCKVELLAPGGSYESVIAAYNAGADAVYTGGELFGARANADNLTTEQLIDAIEYAHIHGKKLYLTINTLLKDKEIDEKLFEYLLPLYTKGLDAVIIQDMGVLKYVKKVFPDMHIHASTQMTIFGKETVKELEKLGVQRIVTPRELSLTEIREIKENSNIEIESFVHGALCYCYSGQCFMSSYIGGRSGNRGRCAQPCRMEYDVCLNGKVLNPGNNKYVISPKDICTLKILPEIIESGVYSLKIEGRMKKTEYITGVVSIYRKYLDMYLNCPDNYQVDNKDITLLGDLFNRNGFSESYYKQHNGKNMISIKKPEFRIENREFIDYLKNNYIGKLLKKEINVEVVCKKDNPFTLRTNLEGEIVSHSGNIPSKALNRPIDEKSIEKQIRKLGNTDFIIGDLKIYLDDGLFIPVGEINEIRRGFIDKVKNSILSKSTRELTKKPEKIICENKAEKLEISAHVFTKEQLEVVLNSELIKTVYLEEALFDAETIREIIISLHENGKKAMLAMPFVFRKKVKEKFDKYLHFYVNIVDGFLIRNQEEYFYLKKYEKDIVFDYGVYTLNKYAKAYYQENGNITTTPLELNVKELNHRGCNNEEVIVYGYMPVMISANCSLKTCDMCTNESLWYVLKDRKNNCFDTKCVCKYCYNIMYNCKPLSLFKYGEEIKGLNPRFVRLSFTKESKKETENILRKAKEAFVEMKYADDDSSTRGHFKRGIL